MKFPSFYLTRSRVLLLAAVHAAAPASAATFSASWNSGFAPSGAVPDGSAGGWFDSRSLAIPADQTVTDVNVSISMSGGWSGDVYAYLTHPNSPGVAVLLNRPGRTGANPFGYGDAIITITLDDGAANGDTHTWQSVTGYGTLITNGSSWQPDGRNVSPLTVNGSEARSAMLNTFNGMAPASGNWTLFVADLVSGDQMTVASWGLSITTIPEPQTTFLALVSAAAVLVRRRQRARIACQ